ncbi:OmpA family protein, partial [Treponema primitia]|uniref:OmpA family protein n=1 Tax=Treponema primitia TaxID=88058 RepID=UPI000570E858
MQQEEAQQQQAAQQESARHEAAVPPEDIAAPVVLADGRRGFALRITVPFGADRSSLGPGVTGRLREIGETLKGYPENRVLIQGHTALAGTMAGRVRIAQERAQATADFLVAGGYVRRDQIELQA